MGRRYLVFELVDPYTNVIGYIGTRTTGAGPGRFAITWTRHPGRRVPGARVIRSAYRRVWVIGRTLAGDRADQRRALTLMRQYRLAPPGGPRKFARGCRPGKPVKAVTPTGLPFLTELDAAMAQNPPPARDRPLLDAWLPSALARVCRLIVPGCRRRLWRRWSVASTRLPPRCPTTPSWPCWRRPR